MGTPPSQPGETQIVGQQSAPSTTVPTGPAGPLYRSAVAPTNNMAVVSLVAAVLSFFSHVIPFVGGLAVAVVAIVTGHVARQQIRQTGERGMWMATLGMVIGIIHVALIGIVVLGLLFVIFVLGVALFGASRH